MGYKYAGKLGVGVAAWRGFESNGPSRLQALLKTGQIADLGYAGSAVFTKDDWGEEVKWRLAKKRRE